MTPVRKLRSIRLTAALGLVLGLAVVYGGASGQLSSPLPVTTRTVHGQVINALSGAGIARALVTMNSRSLLTDSQGRFEFPQFADTSATVMAARPGFSSEANSDVATSARQVQNLDAEVLVRLYPDAVISGVVSGSDGLPLGQVEVVLRRASLNRTQRWMTPAATTTNDRGEYRLRAPAGRFRVSVVYKARLSGSGETLSPISFPDTALNSSQDAFALSPGEERHIDLRPRTGPAFPVTVTMDPAAQRTPGDGPRGGVRFTVSQADGESFAPATQSTGVPGDYRLSLPSGSYMLHAHAEARDEPLDGVAKLTIAGHAVSGIVMRMAPLTSIGVELRPITGLAASTLPGTDTALPDPRQLNLRLAMISDTVAETFAVDTSLRQRADMSYEFLVPAGRYRLQALGQNPWFVTGATYGVTDLVTNDLVAGPAGGGQVIRLIASNEHGRVRGRLAQAAGQSDLWVYLLPVEPSLTLPNPIGVQSDGSYLAWVPAGTYVALAVQGQLQQDLHDPEVIARLTAGAPTINVTKNTETSADLELANLHEAKQ